MNTPFDSFSFDERLKGARESAAATYSCIVDMVNALGVDYARLDELRDMETADMSEEETEELADLSSAAGDCESDEQARDRIQEDPLSVEIRSDWYTPGEDQEPRDFCILLCTGGPAIRIRGELNQYREPYRAWLEIQDWYTPWVEIFGFEDPNDATQQRPIDSGVLLTYAQQFYFGE